LEKNKVYLYEIFIINDVSVKKKKKTALRLRVKEEKEGRIGSPKHTIQFQF